MRKETKNLFDKNDVSGILLRIEKLSPSAKNQWGKMNVSQMMAHCNASLETAMGKHVVPRVFFIGRMIGKLMREGALSEKPFGKGSPTAKSYVFPDTIDFENQKIKLIASIKKFHEGGPAICTSDPHAFFGHFSPQEWAVFEWKHIDHHLRQFGV